MPRVTLIVPFSEKDEAKRLGARWDGQQRIWFVPEGVSAAPFAKWMPQTPSWDVRSSRYWIVSGEIYCWKCDQPTVVYALAVPPGHEILVGDEQDEQWELQDWLSFLMYLTDMDERVLAEVRQRCHGWTLDYSKTTESRYWMNHCHQCNMKQGDFPLHGEPGGAFFPTDEAQLQRLVFQRIDRPLLACASTTFSTFLPDYDG